MIKLSFRFDVSLSKVILGVAGISATICAFQYFMLKNIERKGSSMSYVLQNKTDSTKDNKVSNLVSATPIVKPKLNKDISVWDNFKKIKLIMKQINF